MITILTKTDNTQADDGFVELPGAIETIYQNGVPHIDDHGNRIKTYDAQNSFFPLIFYTGNINPCSNTQDYICTKVPIEAGASGNDTGYSTAKCIGYNLITGSISDPKENPNDYYNRFDLAKDGNFNTINLSNQGCYQNNSAASCWKKSDNTDTAILTKIKQNNLKMIIEYPGRNLIESQKKPNGDPPDNPNGTNTDLVTWLKENNNSNLLGYAMDEERVLVPAIPGTDPPEKIEPEQWRALLNKDYDFSQILKQIDPNHFVSTLETGAWSNHIYPVGTPRVDNEILYSNIWKQNNAKFDMSYFDYYGQIYGRMSSGPNDATGVQPSGLNFIKPSTLPENKFPAAQWNFASAFENAYETAMTKDGEGAKPIFTILPGFMMHDIIYNDPDKKNYISSFPRLIKPIEAKALSVASVIHGATGLGFYIQDDRATRAGNNMGIRPNPPQLYLPDSPDPDNPGQRNPGYFVASEEETRQSNLLWGAVAQTNAEISSLKDIILQPTSKAIYHVFIKDSDPTPESTDYFSGESYPNHIKTILKEYNGKYYLFAVNMENRPIDARFSFDFPIHSVKAIKDWTIDPISGEPVVQPDRSINTIAPTNQIFQDSFGGLVTHIYEINTINPSILTISSSPNIAASGQEITYSITLTNREIGQVSNSNIFIPIPSGTQFISASDGGQQSGDQVVWGPFTIPKDESKQVILKVRISQQ